MNLAGYVNHSFGGINMLITIDRIEGNYAVCELENGEFENLPKAFLPSGSKEGSKVKIELDLAAEEKDRDRIKAKMNSLFKD